MFLKIILMFCISLSAKAQIIHIEDLAPKVRFINISSKGIVKYKFRDGGIKLTIRSHENRLAVVNPQILSSLIQSYKNRGAWVKIGSSDSEDQTISSK
ncbi:hypothetical protein K2X05_12450 [bacterium]|nr:hypothetical protein [bacterium]